MTEKYENGHDSEKQIPAGADNGSENFDVIELSDIAIGITPEDDAIVELTEELIGEAFVGFAGAISDVLHDDEQRLDLSETTPDLGLSGDDSHSGIDSKASESDPVSDEPDAECDNLEADISQELDSYFGTDEGTPANEETTPIGQPKSINQAESSDQPESMLKTEDQPGAQIEARAIEEKKIQLDEISISARHLDDALERVIRKMYGEKINRILDEIIERTVSEEISQLKDYLIGIAVKE
ncbi:MAG: hypothetical protein PF482_04295 [Desulfobacteraceae bacterium]|jgi:hypothetical protein|nr:hypothetical protein [Desulfobacteraceae bacterium]